MADNKAKTLSNSVMGSSGMVEKMTPADYIFSVINYLFFGIFTISCIFPFYYIFINTISDPSFVTSGQITLLPKGITIENYIRDRKSVVKFTLNKWSWSY